MYEKIKEAIKKHDNIVVAIIMMLAVSIFALHTKLFISDELWNFANIYKMYNGLTIYNDTNVIITPLFFSIGLIIFRIFGANFLVFRIYNVLIFAALLTLIYVLFKNMKIPKTFAYLGTLMMTYVASRIILAGANYNILAVEFAVLGILIQISIKKGNIKNILHGTIIFLIFLTKQNIGAIYILGIIIYDILQIIRTKEVKKYILETISELIVAFVCLIIFVIYMWHNSNLESFINYCILGISEFHKNFGMDSVFQIITCLLTLLFFSIIAMILNRIIKVEYENKENNDFLLIQGLCFLLIQYPIFNGYHETVSNIIILIYMIYILYNLFSKYTKVFDNYKFFTKVNIAVTIVIVCVSVVHGIIYKNQLEHSEEEIYYGVQMTEEQKEDITLISDFIKNQQANGIDVKVLSYRSMAYTSLLKINNKEFDLPFIGNLGQAGEDGLIREISDLKNTKILITKDEEDRIYQESDSAREYIMNNLEADGEIGDFLIYKSNYFNKDNI